MNEFIQSSLSMKVRSIAIWTLQGFTSAAFLAAGFSKLSGNPMMVETFEHVGLGQWFRYATGVIEIAAAILLLIPQLASVGAATLVCTMAGAVLAHLFVLGGSPLPAIVLLCLASIILWARLPAFKLWFLKQPAVARINRGEAAISSERRNAILNGRWTVPSGEKRAASSKA